MDILENLKFASAAISIVFLLYDTEVIAEYARVFGLSKIFALDHYKCYKIKTPYGNYPSFLRETRDCFFTRLISCSYCLGFWICAVSGFYGCNIFLTYTLYLIILKIIPDNE